MQGHFNHWVVVSVQGVDSADFLHKQLTQNVLSMQSGDCRLFGYCTAQGRLLANGLLVCINQASFWLLMQDSIVDQMVKRLKMFVLRAKVVIERSPLLVGGQLTIEEQTLPKPKLGLIDSKVLHWSVAGEFTFVNDKDVPLAVGCVIDYPSPSGVKREIVVTEKNQLSSGDEKQFLSLWQSFDIQLGLVWLTAKLQEQFIPQMIHLEKMGGVDFKKGCYPGQEVVARAQYRGAVKRGLFLGQCDQKVAQSCPLYVFSDQHNEQASLVGEVVDCAREVDDFGVLSTTTCCNVLLVAHLGLSANPMVSIAPNEWLSIRIS